VFVVMEEEFKVAQYDQPFSWTEDGTDFWKYLADDGRWVWNVQHGVKVGRGVLRRGGGV